MMVESPRRRVALLVWVLVLGWSAPARAVLAPENVPQPTIYDLRPYARFAPWLEIGWRALSTEGPDGEEASAAALKAIEHALGNLAVLKASAPGDPLLEPTARWLRARLRHRLKNHRGAAEDDVMLLGGGSSLANPLRLERAEVAARMGEPIRAAELLLGTAPGTTSHFRATQRAVQLLQEAGEPRRAAEALERAIRGPLSHSARTELSLLAASVWQEIGEDDAAETTLRALWWTSTTSAIQSRAARALGEMDRAIHPLEPVARQVIGPRGKVEAARKALRGVSRGNRRFRRWAQAVLDRHIPDKREDAAKSLRRLAASWDTDPLAPWYHYGRALVLRRLDRDIAAAESYGEIANQWPEHVLAPEALVAAAELTARAGLAAEADSLYRRALRADRFGAADRTALWWTGFHDLHRGELAESTILLKRLLTRYSGDREATGLTWGERAGYWLARALAAAGEEREAAALYGEISLRFPLSWYGILARQRIVDLSPGSQPQRPRSRVVDRPTVVRRPVLDLPVTLARLGDVDQAIRELESLVASGQLPGSGRALLARLYSNLGRVDLGKRTLLRGGVLPEVPTEADLETYETLFPIRHRGLLEAAADKETLPRSLVAGLVYVESRFAPRAVSRAGAVGLMQLMPATARVVGRKGLNRKITRRSLRDPKTNLEVGTRLLAELITHFRGNVPVALAGYNAGRGAARGWLRARGHLPIDAFVETIPYTQARRYVRRVIASAAAYGAIHGIRGGPVRVPAHPPLTLGGFLEESPGQEQ